MSSQSTYDGDILVVMEETAHAAGGIIMARRYDDVTTYNGAGEMVSEAYLASQKAIVKRLRTRFAEIPLYLRESDSHKSESPTRFIIDPLNGITPWAYGNSGFSVSIAFECEGVVELGVVYDPLLRETYVGIRGLGAWRDGRRLLVTQSATLSEALIEFDWGGTDWLRQEGVSDYQTLLAPEICARRIVASFTPALGLAHLAEGRIQALASNGTRPEEHGAGALLVQEAGGEVRNYYGEEFAVHTPGILAAASPVLASDLLGKLPARYT